MSQTNQRIAWSILCLIMLRIGLPASAQKQRVLMKEELTTEERSIFDSSAEQAQRVNTLTSKALRIGDKVPNIVMKKVFNYPGGQARLSDFTGKHILLDFWARNCGSCIGAFPKMERLQKEYSDKIQILAVCTYNTLEALNIFEPGFPKNSASVNIRTTTLPLVFNSEEMVDFFPHSSEPYLVWIDQSGIIRAMIDSWDINNNTIDTMLAGNYSAYPLASSFKRIERGKFADSFYDYYNNAYPILKEGNGRNIDKVVYVKRSMQNSLEYVVLAKLGNALGASACTIQDSTTGQIIGERALYNSLIDLFRYAHAIDDQQLVMVESAHPERYYKPNSGIVSNWLRDHLYSYEVFARTKQVRRALMEEALQDYFKNINANIERRKIKCLVLRRTSQRDKLKTRYPNKPIKHDTSGALLALQNGRYSYVVTKLQYYNLTIHQNKALPIFDETGFPKNYPIDIELKNLKDITGLKDQLKRYDLSLEETEREKEVLVLKDVQIQ